MWGSPCLIAEYEKGNLRPTVDQEIFESGEMEEISDGGDHIITVQALADTPEQIHCTMSPTLAHVLGHSSNVNRRSPSVRTRIPFENLPDSIPGNIPENIPQNIPDNIPENIPENIPGNLPEQVREILVNKPVARISDNERSPSITEQTEITFVSEESVPTNVPLRSDVDNL